MNKYGNGFELPDPKFLCRAVFPAEYVGKIEGSSKMRHPAEVSLSEGYQWERIPERKKPKKKVSAIALILTVPTKRRLKLRATPLKRAGCVSPKDVDIRGKDPVLTIGEHKFVLIEKPIVSIIH